jgi:hypothetical protein
MTVLSRLGQLEGIARTWMAPLPASAVALAEAAGLELDPWQADVLTSTSPRLLLNCCRQSGKSTVTAVLALWTALTEPGSLTLLLSPSQRQSQELFRRCLEVYRVVAPAAPADAETLLRLELANGSRIIALPGKEATIRGFSGVRLIVADEASRCQDSLYYSVRPMVAVSGGRLIALSTPWGKRGFFHREWTEGGDAWQRVQVTAAECPRIPPAFLEEERRSLGRLWFASEYECQFVETDDQVFAYDDVAALLSDAVAPLFAATEAV